LHLLAVVTGFFTGTPNYFSSAVVNGSQTATARESHFVADLMIGRDFGLGSSTAQLQFGIRVADLTANASVNEAASSSFHTFFSATGTTSSTASGKRMAPFLPAMKALFELPAKWVSTGISAIRPLQPSVSGTDFSIPAIKERSRRMGS
jgi:hypothetical protein